MEYDWAVGRVMAKLDALGLANRTLLIVTSDNGGLGAKEIRVSESIHRPTHPWRAHKGSKYEGGHRVPFLARWPGRIPAGLVSDTPLSLVDLAATAAALAGVALPECAALDSFDMMPALLGQPSPRPYVVMGERGLATVSIRQGAWKLIHDSGGAPAELYDLDRDPGETADRATGEPGRTNQLESLLSEHFLRGSSRPGARAEGRPLSAILAGREIRNAIVAEVPGVLLPAAPSASAGAAPAQHTLKWDDMVPFEQGAALFTDRPYRLLAAPESLKGARFLPVPLGGEKGVTIAADGPVWILTPSPDRNRDSQMAALRRQGFETTDLPEFPLWNERPGNRAVILRKDCTEGERIVFGQWAVPVVTP
jgi:hypothetical protein